MSYQVLARKWRPRTFAELSGQQHVVRALANAIEKGRLHHAYLLTGTRGVGKTTIARLIAKSLNCVKGVTAEPCGACDACVAIDAGRFVDLVELDAASNTGVDNMREILDNARYAPTAGRYKVYLIDEVHMLSKGAFNSMLKTLEEPPEHVKFVLATTDPEKVPVTVLSRCLQFNLKPLPLAAIEERLSAILGAEGIAFDTAALGLLARAARGSMRDALSLADQAIGFGAGEVREEGVRAMLGTVDRDFLYRLLDALNAQDGAALLAEGDSLAERGLAPSTALEGLASLLHRVAVAQVVPEAASNYDDAERVRAYATAMTPERVQLAYEIAVRGSRDLELAPDESTGFSMTLLRLLAFAPDAAMAPADAPPSAAPRRAPLAAAASSIATPAATPSRAGAAESRPAPAAPPSTSRPVPAQADPNPPPSTDPKPPPSTDPRPLPSTDPRPLPQTAEQWPALVATLPLTGMALQLASQSAWRGLDGNTLTLALPASHKHLADKAYADKLGAVLERACGRRVMLAFEVGESTAGSLASQREREREEDKARTEAQFREEPFVREAMTRFGATVRPDTIKRTH